MVAERHEESLGSLALLNAQNPNDVLFDLSDSAELTPEFRHTSCPVALDRAIAYTFNPSLSCFEVKETS